MNNRNKTILLLLVCLMLMWRSYNYYSAQRASDVAQANEPTLLQKLKQLRQPEPPEQVKVTVYYEVLCSDSRNFMIKELLPMYLTLHEHVVLDLVPYGKAQTVVGSDGRPDFHCQHGEIECQGNKVHACTIDVVRDDPTRLLQMVACMIDDNIIPLDAAERCAKLHAVDYDEVAACAEGTRGVLLLRRHGERTELVRPSFIPTVQLNGAAKVPLSVILKDLKTQVCNSFASVKPSQC